MTSEQIQKFQKGLGDTTPLNASNDIQKHYHLMVFLSEIAYQLAVANEREAILARCGDHDIETGNRCILIMDHVGGCKYE